MIIKINRVMPRWKFYSARKKQSAMLCNMLNGLIAPEKRVAHRTFLESRHQCLCLVMLLRHISPAAIIATRKLLSRIKDRLGCHVIVN